MILSEEIGSPFGFELRPIVDELVDSFIARHIAVMRPTGIRSIWGSLGRPSPGRQLLLPSGLRKLAAQLPSSTLTFEALVHQHTAFPALEPLLAMEEREKLLEGLGTMLGAMGKHGLDRKNTRLLHCDLCRTEQLTRFGSAGWGRVHQMDGVVVCPWHNCGLRRTLFPAFAREGWNYIMGEVVDYQIVDDPYPPGLAIRIAHLVDFQMNDPSAKVLLQDVPKLIQCLFSDAKLLLSSGMIRYGTRDAFRDAFGVETLRKIGLPLDSSVAASSWLHRVLNGVSRPTQAQLTLILAFMNVEPGSPAPIQPRPLKLPTFGNRQGGNLYLCPNSVMRSRFRSDILKAVADGLTRREIGRIKFTAYRTLRKHDNEWLESKLPKKLSNKGHRKYKSFDDSLFLEKIKTAHATIIALDELPVRITENLLRQLAKVPVMRHHELQLPECIAYIVRHVDTDRTYWSKRFAWVLSKLSRVGVSTSWQEFIDFANFRPYRWPALLPDAQLAYRRLCSETPACLLA